MVIKNITLTYTFIFVFFSSSIFAKNLAITVLEKGTGDAVEGATVVLGQTGEYDVTDKKGFILFEDVGSFKYIKILNSAYETLEETIKLDAGKAGQSETNENITQEITYYIYPLTTEVDALEVVEDRVPEKISKIILVEEELRRVPGTSGDPLKILDSLPGIVSGSNGGGGGPGAVYVRGSGAGDNAVLINRIPVEYLFHFGDLSGIAPSTINPSLVKDFNVFLGGFPVEYEDKLGGILDVQLRNPKKDRIHQNYRLALHESAFLVEGPIKFRSPNRANQNHRQQNSTFEPSDQQLTRMQLDEQPGQEQGREQGQKQTTQDTGYDDSFYIAGRMSYLDKILTPKIINNLIQSGAKEDEKDDFTILTLPKYYDSQATWHRELRKGYFDLNFFAAGDGLAFNLNHAEDTDPELLGDLTFDYDYQSLGANWLHRYNSAFTYLNTLSINNFTEKQQIGTDRNTLKPFFVSVGTVTLQYDPELIWKKNQSHQFSFGASLSYIKSSVDIYVPARPTEDNTNQTFSSAPKYKVDATIKAALASPYLKHQWNITPKLRSTVGLRYSKIRASGGVALAGFSPRGGIEYQISEKLLLVTSWGKYLQRPEGSTILTGFGNPNLKFMHSEHRIAGLEFKATPLWSIKLETYQKLMDKLVLVLPENAPPENYKNIGEGEAYGIDLLLKREFSNRTMGWLSYSYARSTRTTVTGENRTFSGDQPHSLNMVWSQPFTGSWNRWTWGVKLTMHSGALHTPIIGRAGICTSGENYVSCTDQVNSESDVNFSHWEPVKAKQNSMRLPFYYLMSVRLDREIRYNTWKMNVFVDIQNLSYRKNIVGYNYGKKFEKIDDPEPVAGFFLPIPLFGVEAEF